MASQQIAGAYIQGKSSQPSKAWQGSAWSTNIPVELRRLEALLRRAALALNLGDNARNYLRPIQSLEGHGIKQNLPWSKTGVLSPAEQRFFATRYAAGAEALEELKAEMSPETVSLETVRGLPLRLRKISEMLREPSVAINRLTTTRFKALEQGLSKKEVQNVRRQPIETRLVQMDLSTRICFFNPMMLLGRIFHLDSELEKAVDKGDLSAIDEAKSQLMNFATSSKDSDIVALMEQFIFTF